MPSDERVHAQGTAQPLGIGNTCQRTSFRHFVMAAPPAIRALPARLKRTGRPVRLAELSDGRWCAVLRQGVHPLLVALRHPASTHCLVQID